MKREDETLDKVMDRWESKFSADSGLLFKVMAEGARREREASSDEPGSLIEWLRGTLARPAFAAGFAVLFIFVGAGVSQFFHQGLGRNAEDLTLTYRLSIDPLYRMKAVAGIEDLKSGVAEDAQLSKEQATVLLTSLGWLQGELGLTEPQYDKISALHSDYGSEFDKLFAELMQSHQAYREIDRKRMSNDVVDYFELYELLQRQKQLSEESSRLTAELMERVSEVINPEQRERYRKLFSGVYPDHSRTEKANTDA